ncbi:MAG: DsbE family thiol:disulfide interchange protein [Pseudooceanicola sp.]|nr:DsbE family thiol:disulfide interchange protein [Pseudooceanicola sp.]
MAKISPLMLLPPAIFVGLGAMFYMGMQEDGPRVLPSMFIGKEAPPVTEETLPGYTGLRPGDLATGELTLVNFWASWCGPCRAEHPTLTKLSESGLRVVGVNFGDDRDDALKFLSDNGNPFALVAFDPGRNTSVDWGVTAPPESFLVDGSGKVVYKFVGPLVGDDYRQRFLPELEKARAAVADAAAPEAPKPAGEGAPAGN